VLTIPSSHTLFSDAAYRTLARAARQMVSQLRQAYRTRRRKTHGNAAQALNRETQGAR